MMIRKARWPGFSDIRRLTLASVLAVTAAYWVRLPIEISMGSAVLSALSTENFHDAEGHYRWTRARSSLVFPDPGPGLDVKVESLVSGFRPRGQTPPMLVMEAGGESLRVRPGRGETLILKTRTDGWWSSNLEVRFRSETYTPSEMDRRALGVRVHHVRLVAEGAPIGLGRPPLRQLVTVTLGLLLLLSLLVNRDQSPRRALWVGYTVAFFWWLGFAFARPYAALISLPFFTATALALGVSLVFPSAAAVLGDVFHESLHAGRRGLHALIGWPTAAFLLVGAAGVTATTLGRPEIDIDLGTGRETTLLKQFGSFDQSQAVDFRRALRGAQIDLGDFGGGAEWTLNVTASLARRTEELIVARVGEEDVRANLGTKWTEHPLIVKVPVGWRPGPLVEFPSASEGVELRVDRLRIERGRSLPSLHLVACALATALLVLVGFRGVGLGPGPAWMGVGAVLALELIAMTVDPLLAIPFAPTFFLAAAGGVVLMLVASSFLTALARRQITPSPVPAAMAASGMGFVAWLSATLFPLYQGGHFVFHSSIAEEIWNGKFQTYYLPYPGSMLSRQAQWGNIIVPHSCLYHTVMAPLAALPREWFYGLEKAGLAVMLAVTVVVASIVATRVGSPRAGAYAGVFAACLPPTFQLLGLGHLMTLFGVFAGALALGFITLRFDHLQNRNTWVWASFLLTLCFLSYTASLLLTMTALVTVLPLLFRRSAVPSRALLGAVVTASAVSFVLYYVHWTLPFLRESLPAIFSNMGTSASDSSLWTRVAAIPHKLTYTYGSAVLPTMGLVGLTLARPSSLRILLVGWAGTLVLYSAVDLFFNFLLKHHYFVVPAVGIGCGLFAAWLSQKGRWGRVLAAVLVIYATVSGARAALGVALG